MPPQRSGIADHSFDLLVALAAHLDVVAVVRDDVVDEVRAPEGVGVAGASAYAAGAAGAVDLDVYQMGNHFDFHAFMHAHALDHAGLLVLHDPALVDFYGRLCGGVTSETFLEEARRNVPAVGTTVPTVRVDGRDEPDRLELLMSKRLVEASLATVVHSAWARGELLRRSPAARVEHVQPPAPAGAGGLPSVKAPGEEVTFGVFGSLEVHRVRVALDAFVRIHADFPNARLVVVGRCDDRQLEHDLRAASAEHAVRVETNVTTGAFEHEVHSCDVALSLRWPTAGETSAIVRRALAAGRPVVVSDLPQYRDLDPAFCWRIPVAPDAEAPALEAVMRRALSDPGGLAASGAAALAFVRAEAQFEMVCARFVALVEECVRSKAGHAGKGAPAPAVPGNGLARPRPRGPGLPGCALNVHGDWRQTTGLAEAARRSVAALVGAGCQVRAAEFRIPGAPHREERAPWWLETLRSIPEGDVDLWHLNVNELGCVADHLLRPGGRDPYVVAFWFWELPLVARAFAAQARRVDEIWVGSEFTAHAFRGCTDRPIRVMPCVVEPRPDSRLARPDFGLPRDSCLFFFNFDADSNLTRKNPWGIVRAFREAFGDAGHPRATLAVKAMNLESSPGARARLLRELGEVGGLLLEDHLTDAEMAALIGLCDVYVSLHRSEGFGLGMAEAMCLGRPVIATAYSGNMDYMTQGNAALVSYELRAIRESDHRFNEGAAVVYEIGQLWAEPHLGHAARWMRHLCDSPAERARLGAAGARAVQARYSSAAAASAMTARVGEIRQARLATALPG